MDNFPLIHAGMSVKCLVGHTTPVRSNYTATVGGEPVYIQGRFITFSDNGYAALVQIYDKDTCTHHVMYCNLENLFLLGD